MANNQLDTLGTLGLEALPDLAVLCVQRNQLTTLSQVCCAVLCCIMRYVRCMASAPRPDCALRAVQPVDHALTGTLRCAAVCGDVLRCAALRAVLRVA